MDASYYNIYYVPTIIFYEFQRSAFGVRTFRLSADAAMIPKSRPSVPKPKTAIGGHQKMNRADALFRTKNNSNSNILSL
jgi:hypothetical protein